MGGGFLMKTEVTGSGATLVDEYSVKTEGQALRHALEPLGVEQADFAGWSYGGEVLLDFALDHPQRVRSLTLIEPPAFWVLSSRGPLSREALGFREVARTFGPGEISEDQLAQFARFAGFVPPGAHALHIASMDRFMRLLEQFLMARQVN